MPTLRRSFQRQLGWHGWLPLLLDHVRLCRSKKIRIALSPSPPRRIRTICGFIRSSQRAARATHIGSSMRSDVQGVCGTEWWRGPEGGLWHGELQTYLRFRIDSLLTKPNINQSTTGLLLALLGTSPLVDSPPSDPPSTTTLNPPPVHWWMVDSSGLRPLHWPARRQADGHGRSDPGDGERRRQTRGPDLVGWVAPAGHSLTATSNSILAERRATAENLCVRRARGERARAIGGAGAERAGRSGDAPPSTF